MAAFLDTMIFYRAHGTMPEAGGLLDQPATWVEAASVLMRRLSDIERDQIEAARHDAERGRRKRPGPRRPAPRPKR